MTYTITLFTTYNNPPHLDSTPADGPDGLPDEVHVDLRGVLLELAQHLRDVGLRRQPDHYVQLLQLHVDWIVVLYEEYLGVKIFIYLIILFYVTSFYVINAKVCDY